MVDVRADSGIENLFSDYKAKYNSRKPEEYSLGEYFEIARNDPSAYATSGERMLKAIGAPKIIDTALDPRLSRIYSNRKIAVYPAFKDFYGMEDVISDVVGYFRKAAQGLEEKKQILYLMGPVGSSKSSLAERLVHLMEQEPIYVLAAERASGQFEFSPVNESPLALFSPSDAAMLEQQFHISGRYLDKNYMSPWATKCLEEFEGDISRFHVMKVYPSQDKKIAIGRLEPGDDTNQDVSALIGRVDIRKIEEYSQDDADAYSFSGALATGNRGILEFVEMFKAPIKVLHPLLTATQDGKYTGTDVGVIPFDGIVLAHSNESEWEKFKNNRDNEAFLDRVFTVTVPYSLRVSDELRIYQKMLRGSQLVDASCAPGTLEMAAQFAVLTRLMEPENSSIYSKMRVYDGENLKQTDAKAKSLTEYKDAAGPTEGMSGFSTRSAFKALSEVFNFNSHLGNDPEANPVHLLYVLEKHIEKEYSGETQATYRGFVKEFLAPTYAEKLGKEIQSAYLESYAEYGQNVFDRYVQNADAWIQDTEMRDPNTGVILDRAALNAELEQIEKPAGISNPKDFRNEVVNFVLRAKAKNGGKNPEWTSYEKLCAVIQKKIFSNTEELLPVISFSNAKASADDAKKHDKYVARMMSRGYSKKQVSLVTEWYLRVRKGSGKSPS